jgi:cell wall-associated NlpC family hydrolase
MRFAFRSALAAITAASLVFTFAVPVEASSGSSSQTKQQIDQYLDEAERLGRKVDDYAEAYAAAVDNKAKLDVEVTDAEARVAAKQAEVDALNADLSNMAVEAFVGGGGGGTITTLLSGGQGPNDAVQREEFSDVAYNTGAQTTNDYEQLVRELDGERADLDSKREQVQELADQISANKDNAEKAIADYQEKAAAAKVKYGEQLAAEQAARDAAAAKKAQEQIAKAQAEARAAAARSPQTGDSGSGGGRGGGTAADSGSSGSSDSGSSDSGGSDSGGSSGGVDPNAGSGGGSSLGAIAVSAAQSQLGVPYKFAAESPGVAFDCSGLTKYAWGKAGVSLPHQSAQQYASTPHVSMGNLAPGDLIFYYSPISHVSIYIGGGMVIHAPATGDVVKISSLSGNAIGASRPG